MASRRTTLLSPPDPGQLVEVRQRRFVVTEVEKSVLPPHPAYDGSERAHFPVPLSTTGLVHGLNETKQGVRYTLNETARRDVLGRLLKLNRERYAEEVAQGLHSKQKTGGRRQKAQNLEESRG